MPAGYVYILTNPSMPGLIKVGRTFRDSRARAKELHTTGVPSPFEVSFEVFSEEHESLEKKLHAQIDEFRVNGNREFFRYPLRSAIQALLDLSSPLAKTPSTYFSESIFHRLVEKYRNCMKPEIVDVRIVQTKDRVWLEITGEHMIGEDLVDQIIKRSDLAFCTGGDSQDRYFSPNGSVSENASKFIENWDPYSIIMTTDLFHDEACVQIDNDPKFNPHG